MEIIRRVCHTAAARPLGKHLVQNCLLCGTVAEPVDIAGGRGGRGGGPAGENRCEQQRVLWVPLAHISERLPERVEQAAAQVAAWEVLLSSAMVNGLAAGRGGVENNGLWDAGKHPKDERGRRARKPRAREGETKPGTDAFGVLPRQGITQAENIQRGQRAMQWVQNHKRELRGAMWREEVGEIDFPRGVTGDPAKDFGGGYGLSHILAKHGEADLKMLPHALARGEITQNAADPAKRDVTWGSYLAVLVKENQRGAWTLSAYTRR